MSVSDKTLARVAAQEESAEIERRRLRGLRIAAAIGSVECDTPAAERLIRGFTQARKGTRDGVSGASRKATKSIKDDTGAAARTIDKDGTRAVPAVQWADRSNVTGDLTRIKIAASSRDTRRQAQTRNAIAGFDARADRLSKMRAKMRANQPGGEVWKTCTSRAQKQACKSRAKAIAKKIERGQY